MNPDQATRLESDIDAALGRGDLDQAEILAQRYRTGAAEPFQRFRAGWLSAQVALSAGRLEEARTRLRELHPLPANLPAALTSRVWLAHAEIVARLGDMDAARASLSRAAAFSREMAINPLLELRNLRVRLILGDVEAIESPLAACREALRQRDDRANLALLHCEEGRAWDTRGRLDRARDCWERAEQVSRSLNDDPVRADVLIQLGRLEHLHGHLQAALDRYDQACAATSVTAQQHESRLRRALVLLDLNQWNQARTDLDRLEHNWVRRPPPDELAPLVRMVKSLVTGDAETGGETAAFQAAQRGDAVEARALYEQALVEADAPPRRARISLALGLVALASGDLVEGRRWLATAEELAREQALPEVLWRALQGRGQAAAATGDDDHARELFEQAVLVSETQSRKLRHRVDAMTHGVRREAVLRGLLLAACQRGDASAAFRYQELERGRLLLELWRSAPPSVHTRRLADDPRFTRIDGLLAEIERDLIGRTGAEGEALLRRRDELLLTRDRLLDEFLRDRSRVGEAGLPALPELSDLESSLQCGTLYLAPAFIGDQLFVLAVRADGSTRIIRAAGAAEIARLSVEVRRCLDRQLSKYRLGLLTTADRGELDARLGDLGASGLGDAIWSCLDESRASRLIWVPDGPLHGLPIHALRRGGRYLVETHEVLQTFGGAFVVHQARSRPRSSWWRRSLVVSESPAVLPSAQREGEGVAATFARCDILNGGRATREALRHGLARASVAHFACHAYFDDRHALSACVGLPSGETWRALDFFDESLDGLPLVTLSACRSAEVAPLAGKEVFGLVTGLLAAGVRSVVAGLWPVTDREALPLMWRFYRHRLLHDVPTALALAQRDTLAQREASPLFWAAFAFFGDPAALPAPGAWTRWLARRRQRRHERQYPIPSSDA